MTNRMGPHNNRYNYEMANRTGPHNNMLNYETQMEWDRATIVVTTKCKYNWTAQQ